MTQKNGSAQSAIKKSKTLLKKFTYISLLFVYNFTRRITTKKKGTIKPACFRKFVPLVFLRVEVRQLHFRLRSTVMVRKGSQEGAAKGHNPKRPGRLSHHPLLAFVSDVRMIANYWLRPGNTSASVSVQKCQNAFICGPFAKPANFIFNFLSLKKSSLQTNCHRKQVLVIRPTRLHSLE